MSFLPLPSVGKQKLFALLVLLAQAGIAVTGSIVRVTGSGLGCDTWPQCHPGSFTPVPGAAPALHQAIEFGNRLLTFVLIVITLVLFLAVVRAGRRKSIIVLSFIEGFGIIVQAVIGGISVHVDLNWIWVAFHFLPSMVLVWIAGVIWVQVGQPDDGQLERRYPTALRWLSVLMGVAVSLTLVSGTMVTGAGPHAGDADVTPEERLNLPIVELTHVHAGFMYLLLGLVVGLTMALIALKVERRVLIVGWALIAVIISQAVVGMVQYWTGTPAALVPVHIAGSGAVTGLAGMLYAFGRDRVGGTATNYGSLAAEQDPKAKAKA
nr:COX15/CtaA family protein [Corynebacterium sp. TAE3-ERU12]